MFYLQKKKNIKNHKTLHEAWNDKKIEEIRNNWFSGKLKKCCTQCSHYEPYTNLTKRNFINKNLKKIYDKFFGKKSANKRTCSRGFKKKTY